MKVLVCDPIHEDAIDMLREFSEVDISTDLDHEELLEKVSDFDAMVVRSATKVTKDVLDAADNLRLIVRAGVGLDNIDLDYSEEIDVQVENTPEASTTAAAELTFALMLAWARNVTKADSSMKEGKWLKSQLVGTELSGKTLGVIGTGRIGRSVAEKASAFGMNILGHDIVESVDFEDIGGEYVDIETLLSESDYITLHLPSNFSTRHMIGEDEFGLMKDSAVLVNVARGDIVVEDALVDSLKERRIAGACLDVYDSDPIEDGRLLELPNVILMPHLGASTEEAQRGVGVLAAEKIKHILG